MPSEPIRFTCRCGRNVVTDAGSPADEARCCTRCRLRSLRTGGDLVRHDEVAEHRVRAG